MKHSLVVCTVLAFATLAGCRRTVPEHDVLFLQAVQDGNLPRIQALLDSGANVNAGWEEGEALRKAVMHEDVELIRLLLSRGAKVNVASWRGWTPLFDAVVRQDNQEIAELLLSHGADANHKDDAGHLLLHHSLGPSGRPGMAELLIAGGADIHALDREGRTAIRIAVEQGRREALEMLLKKGAREDERGPRGQTLLHYAALRGHGSIATLLMAQGLDVNAKDDSGRTPLHGAAEENSLWVAEVLLNAGADPNAASDSGMTPLHIAAGGGHCAMAELLTERGADRTAKTRRGYTPADLARDAGHQDVVSLLAGAPPRKSVSQVLVEGESSEVVPVKRLVRDNSALAFDLYRKLCVEKGNWFFSPYSVSTALALVYAGARENTAREIAVAMHFSSGPEGLHPAFSELQAGLNEVQKAGNVKLHVANSLWPQKGFELLPDYLALVRHSMVPVSRLWISTRTKSGHARRSTNGSRKRRNGGSRTFCSRVCSPIRLFSCWSTPSTSKELGRTSLTRTTGGMKRSMSPRNDPCRRRSCGNACDSDTQSSTPCRLWNSRTVVASSPCWFYCPTGSMDWRAWNSLCR